jgi:hypothetical protein
MMKLKLALRRMIKKLKKYGTLRVRIILDINKVVGNHSIKDGSIRSDYCKEAVSRRYILGRSGVDMKFFDVGSRDGQLTYLLGITSNMNFDKDFYDSNLTKFTEKYEYWGVDLEKELQSGSHSKIILGDICKTSFTILHQDLIEAFDIVYSNNVFEHLENPFCAA